MDVETLIQKSSKEIAKKFNDAAKEASSEEDIRYRCNKVIDDFIKSAGLKIKARHDYSIKGGRIDSKYGAVLIEYKKGGSISPDDSEAPGTKAVIEQLKGRFDPFSRQNNIPPERIIGVGLDGNTFVFVVCKGKNKWDISVTNVTSATVQRFLRILVSVGARGRSFTPENLVNDFSAESLLARRSVQTLYNSLQNGNREEIDIFFRQWKLFFGEVCGYSDNLVTKNAKAFNELCGLYEIKDANLDHLFLLFTHITQFL